LFFFLCPNSKNSCALHIIYTGMMMVTIWQWYDDNNGDDYDHKSPLLWRLCISLHSPFVGLSTLSATLCVYNCRRNWHVISKFKLTCCTSQVKSRRVRLLINSISELLAITCHMRSQTVVCRSAQVNTPLSQTDLPIPRRDEKLSWPRWLVVYRNGLPLCRQSPIQVITGPSVEQLLKPTFL